MKTNMEKSLENIAKKAAKEAGKLLMSRYGKVKVIGAHSGGLNPITKEDEEVELKIIGIIKSTFPEHDFLGEELGAHNNKSDYKWIIDPIDGTNNYVDGRDSFSVSIGLEYRGKMVMGVVYLPKRKELFFAKKGKGATLNGKPIHPGKNYDLSTAVVNFSTVIDYEKNTKKLRKKIADLIPNLKEFGFKDKKDIDPVFGRGSMAAEFCYLACGRIDGLVRLKQKPWDVAAGSLIASEAGVDMLNLKGKQCSVYEGDYVAANPKLLKKLMQIVNQK